MSPHWAVDIEGEVGHPVCCLYEWRAFAQRGIRNARAVEGLTELDLLIERRRRSGFAEHLLDWGNELIAATSHRSYRVLRVTVVANRLAYGLDTASECSLTNKSAAPNGIEELDLGDDPIAVLEEVEQHIEDLWFHVHNRAVPSELVALRIKPTRRKREHLIDPTNRGFASVGR